MAATASGAKLSTQLQVKSYVMAAAGPADVAWVDFQDFEYFLAVVTRVIGTTGLSSFKIIGNSAADGSGTDVTIVDEGTAGGTADAVGDVVIAECTAEMAREVAVTAGIDIRGISVSMGHVTGTDDSAVTYIMGGAKHPRSGLTANVIA